MTRRVSVPEISLSAEGGRVSDEALVSARFFRPRDRLILLVHGYNVEEQEAVASIEKFRSALGSYSPKLKEDSSVCRWSGNWYNAWLLRPVAYPFALKNAIESAKTLKEAIYDWYARADAVDELVIVAHSLGCRLVLEALREMKYGGRPENLKRMVVVLMAPAVPVDHLQQAGRLADAISVPNKLVVLHSQDDEVLSSFFGLGQTVSRDCWFPEAVGRYGNPIEISWSRSQQMRFYGHGDYWSERETAEILCEELDITIPASKRAVSLIEQRRLAKHRVLVAPRLPIY